MDPKGFININDGLVGGGMDAMVAHGHAMMGSKLSKSSAGVPTTKYKKAPDAPKRFKSAFIIFSAEKHKEIKEELTKQGRAEKTTDIAKLVSEAWREMEPTAKEEWENRARKDKARYEVEKSMYKGPWKIPANKRTPKDPTAPKRPMSAFLAFSNKRRAGLKREHPDATNADLSKMLSKTWKEAPEELRKKYMEEEAELRSHYKVEMAKWRKKVAEERKQERTEREDLAMQAAEARANEPPESKLGVGVGGPNGMNVSYGGNVNNGMPGGVVNPNHQGMMRGGGPMQPNDMNGHMYGNHFNHAGGGQMNGGMNNFMPGGGPAAAGGAGGPSPEYANLMGGNHAFGSQFMGATNAASQQLLINQILGQQFKSAQSMGQGNPLGMYPGLGQQGMQGQGNQRQGMQGGAFGNPGGYNFMGSNGMDAQRGMFDASQNNGQQTMPQQMPNHSAAPSGGAPFNNGFNNVGGVMANGANINNGMANGANVNNGNGGGANGNGNAGNEWMGNNGGAFNRSEQDKNDDEQQQYDRRMV